MADLRFAIRQLGRAKAFSLSTIAILGIGIGASAALFGTADAVLIKMLPVERPQELRRLAWLDAERSAFCRSYDGSMQKGPPGTRLATSFAYPVYAYVRDHTASFSQLVTFSQSRRLNLTLGGDARLANGLLVSGNFFGALGTRPLLGRVLSPEDDTDGELGYAGVLGYGFWQREFGGERSVLGQTLLVNGTPVVIVGVLPRGACGVDPSWCPDLSLPMVMQPIVDAGPSVLHEPRRWGFEVMGRLRPGVSDESARLETERLVAEAIRTAPPPEAWDPPRALLLPGAQGLQDLRSDLREPIVVLGGAVATVLLVACANVAGLLLARASGRRRELGTRLALGAGRGRLVRQLLTESLLLSALGGALGLVLAYLVGDGIGRAFLGGERPLGVEVVIGSRVLLFTASLLVLVGIAFGLLPALRATRADPLPALREGRFSPERSPMRAGKALVGLQVALSLALVAGSALFVRTLFNLRSETLGFRPENLLVFQLDPTLNGYRDGRLLDFHEQVLRQRRGASRRSRGLDVALGAPRRQPHQRRRQGARRPGHRHRSALRRSALLRDARLCARGGPRRGAGRPRGRARRGRREPGARAPARPARPRTQAADVRHAGRGGRRGRRHQVRQPARGRPADGLRALPPEPAALDDVRGPLRARARGPRAFAPGSREAGRRRTFRSTRSRRRPSA